MRPGQLHAIRSLPAYREVVLLIQKRRCGAFRHDRHRASSIRKATARQSDARDTAPEGFIGQAAVVLLPQLKEEWVRRAVVIGATADHYESSSHVLTTAFRLRDRLGPEFSRLQNLTIVWSAARRSATYVFGADDNENILSRRRGMMIQRYLKGKDQNRAVSLERADLVGKRMLRRRERRDTNYLERRDFDRNEKRLHRSSSGLDLDVLRYGFDFLDEMTQVAESSEREHLVVRCKEILTFALSMVPQVSKDDVDLDIEGPLLEFDHWMFQRIVHVMLSGISPAEARKFCEPVLTLPPAEHDWVRGFFEEWFRLGLHAKAQNFVAIWSEMILFMLDSEVWSPSRTYGWYHIDEIVAHLMGIRSASRSLGEAKNASLIETMAPLYERWADRWIHRADLASSFSNFLSTEAGSVLLPMGMRRLADVLPSFSDYDWTREHLTNTLSAAVRTFWKKFRAQLSSDPNLWKAFVTVLNALCARQDALALEIQSQLTRSGASP